MVISRSRWWPILSILAVLLSSFAGMHALAQADAELWTDPTNLSQSGAASQPAIVALPGGGVRVFWWDRFDGVTMSERDASLDAPWSRPVATPIRIFRPFEQPNADGETGEYAPIATMPEIVGDPAGRAHALWLGAPDEETGARPLLHARLLPGSQTWSTAQTLASAASGFAMAGDGTGGLHLAYVRDLDASGQPAGVYYRRSSDGGASWGAAAALAQSRYYRLLAPEETYLDLATDEAGTLYLTWNDPYQAGIRLSSSSNGGATWGEPRRIGAPSDGPAAGGDPQQGRLIALPGAEALLLWDVRRPNGTCTLYQAGTRVLLEGASEDGAPVLTERLACGQEISFLMLDGRTTMAIEEPDGSLYTATWDGATWWPARPLAVQFAGPEGQGVRLHDLRLAEATGEGAGETLFVAGVDEAAEVWAANGQVEALAPLAPTPTSTPRLRTDSADAESAPINLSRSGAASEPAIMALPGGALRALWWDQFDGLTAADGVIAGVGAGGEESSTTVALWSDPLPVPIQHVETTISVDPETEQVTVQTERTPVQGMPRFVTDGQGRLHAFWLGASDRALMHAATEVGGLYWSPAEVVAPSVFAFNVFAGFSSGAGDLHLAYLVARETPERAAGLYYMRSDDGGVTWEQAAVVDRSRYYRLFEIEADDGAEPHQAHLRVAASAASRSGVAVYLTWDDPRTERAQLAASTDGGRTWSPPTTWGDAEAAPRRGQLFVAQDEAWLMWEDANQGDCALYQARADAVLNDPASAGERVLDDLAVCSQDARFLSLPDGGVLLVAGSGSDVLTVAAFDNAGAQWSEPRHLSYRFEDPERGTPVYLGALQAALALDPTGQNPVLVAAGTDGEDDVWVMPGGMGALDLVFAPPSPWAPLANVSQLEESSASETLGLSAIAADAEGGLHLLWAQGDAAGGSGKALYYSRRSAAGEDEGSWTRPVAVLRSPVDGASASTSAGDAQEPSLAVQGERLHALWSGGANGQIWYSRAFLRDAYMAEGWEEPRPLPGPTEDLEDGFEAGSAPHLFAGPDGALHALYAVPVNEGRGIYYTRSDDGGETWSPSVAVFDAAAAGWVSVDTPRLAVDAATGTLHAVWVRAALVADQSPQGVYYAHSEDNGETWSEAQIVVEGAYAWPQVAVSGPGQVHLLWNAVSGSRTWWHRRTLGEGGGALSAQTGWAGWTRPEQVPGFDDVPGPVGLVADSAGVLHLAGLGQDLYGEPVLLYTTWVGGQWGALEAQRLEVRGIESGISAAAGCGGANCASVQVAIAFRAQARGDGAAQMELWQSSRAIEADGAATAASPATTLAPDAAEEPAPTKELVGAETPDAGTPAADATAGVESASEIAPPVGGEGVGTSLPLLLGGGLVALIVAAILGTRSFWARRR